MAADRAPTIATTIHEDLPPAGQGPARARRQQRSHQREGKREHGVLELDHFEHGANAAWSHNLCRRFRASSRFRLAAGPPGPAILLILRQFNLRQHATGKLLDYILDCFRRVIKRGHGRHHGGPGIMHPHHIFQMDPIERRFIIALSGVCTPGAPYVNKSVRLGRRTRRNNAAIPARTTIDFLICYPFSP